MAENRYNPTFANILSSLKVKGATVVGGTGKDGHVPVLNENGKLDLSVIPVESIENSLTIQPLNNIAFVNVNDSRPDISRDGSIALPYTSLEAAASASFKNFILVPGNYNDATVALTYSDDATALTEGESLIVNVFGIGRATFSRLTLSNYAAGTIFRFYNIEVTGTLSFPKNIETCGLVLDGASNINNISVSDVASTVSVYIGAHATVGEHSGNGTVNVSYIASSGRIQNDSPHVSGGTVADAIDALGTRKIRIPIFAVNSQGIYIDSSDSNCYEDISVPANGDTYSVVAIGTTLATVINRTFHKDGDSPEYNTVTASKIVAENVSAGSVTTQTLNFGVASSIKATLAVDSDNFLVIASS